MLRSYAHMKGRNPNRKNDPLHSALFPGKNRRVFLHRLWLPIFRGEKFSIEELPRSASYYWDPMTHVDLATQPSIVEEILLGIRAVPSSPPPASYAEYLSRHPPQAATNLYSGKEIFANFGYLRVNKTWVDPDSEGQLHNAYVKGGIDAEAAYQTYVGDGTKQTGPYAFQKPRTDANGIIIPDDLDLFYNDFVGFVDDDMDGEGDPRNYRISPQTFARWAVGAKFPEPYEDTFVAPSPRDIFPRPTVFTTEVPNRIVKRKIQFDIETMSVMSGIYDVEMEPTLLEEPEGVDPLRPPHNFSMMNPHAARELSRQAYCPAWGDEYQRSVLPSVAASTPECFTSEYGAEMLAQPGNPESGIREYENAKALLRGVQWEAQRRAMQNYDTYLGMEAAGGHRRGLEQQVHLLKSRMKETTGLKTHHEEDAEIEASETESLSIYDPPSSPATIQKTRERREYRRHLDEALSTQEIEVARARTMQVRLKREYDDILSDILALTKTKDALLEKMGVMHIDDIPDLFPTRQDGNKDFRAQLNQRLQQGP